MLKRIKPEPRCAVVKQKRPLFRGKGVETTGNALVAACFGLRSDLYLEVKVLKLEWACAEQVNALKRPLFRGKGVETPLQQGDTRK